MFENIEDKFKKLMKREGLQNLIEKPNNVFIASFRSYGEENATRIGEFDTKEERDIWYESLGKWLEQEEGGNIEFDFGPTNTDKSIENKDE